MTTGEMLSWTSRFNDIISRSVDIEMQDRRLGIMMADLEKTYGIPAERNVNFEKENPYVIQLYRTVSDARTF